MLTEAQPIQKTIPVVDAFIHMERLVIEQGVDVTDLVLEAHTLFANDEPYIAEAPHENDRWHKFLNFSVRVLECTESSGDRNQDVNAMLGMFVTHYSQK